MSLPNQVSQWDLLVLLCNFKVHRKNDIKGDRHRWWQRGLSQYPLGISPSMRPVSHLFIHAMSSFQPNMRLVYSSST